MGRRKFLKPIYTELMKTPEGQERAREIYPKARPDTTPSRRPPSTGSWASSDESGPRRALPIGMMGDTGRLAALAILFLSSALAADLVTSVEVPGSNLQVNLATQVGRPFDVRAVEKDVRYLWGLGRFEDIRVETAQQPDGVAVVFRTARAPIQMLHEIRIEPHTFGLQIRIPEHTPMTDFRAHATAMQAQHQLNQQGYQNARVTYAMTPAAKSQVDLKLTVDLGDAIRVRQVTFEGAGDRPPTASLRSLRARRLLFWKLLPSYSPEAVESDAAWIRSSYLQKGYLDADVHPGPVEITGKNAAVTIVVNPGERHAIDPGLCRSLLTQRREAERAGIMEFNATLNAAGEVTWTGARHTASGESNSPAIATTATASCAATSCSKKARFSTSAGSVAASPI